MKLSEIRAAASQISARVLRTPLVEIPGKHTHREDLRVFLKLENEQTSGSFKARGATHFIQQLLRTASPLGVVTYSSGNHGRAVAEAARDVGLAAIVTVPDDVDASKAAAIAEAGAEVVRAGPTSESRCRIALDIARERDFEVVPPFDHEWIIAGQGTVGLEILEELEELTAVWVPVGGGGLISGVTAALRAERPDVTVYGVEPVSAAPLARSLAAGRRLTLEETHSVADGLLPLEIGERNWEILAAAGVQPVTVKDEDIVSALRLLRKDLGIAAEPSAAIAVAPLFFGDRIDAGREAAPGIHVAIVSGGNVAPERLADLLARE